MMKNTLLFIFLSLTFSVCHGQGNNLDKGQIGYIPNGKSYPELLAHFAGANDKYLHRDFKASEVRISYGRPRTDGAIFEKAGYKAIDLYTSGSVKPVCYQAPPDNADALTPEIMEDAAKLLFLGVLNLANDRTIVAK